MACEDNGLPSQIDTLAEDPLSSPSDRPKKLLSLLAPGEMGKAVLLPPPGNLSYEANKTEIDKGWKEYGFNEHVSNMISVHRSLPDVRHPL